MLHKEGLKLIKLNKFLMTYDIQFHTLATSDHSVHWDLRHTGSWLQCMLSATLHNSQSGQ